IPEQPMQLFREEFAGTRPGPWFTPATPSPVVGTDASELRDLRLNPPPVERAGGEACLQNHCRRTFPGTLKVQPMPAHTHHAAGRRVPAPLSRLCDGLVGRSPTHQRSQPTEDVGDPALHPSLF